MSKPRVISLFAGIGGFDLGFERTGFEIVAHVEIDPKCRELLKSKWPDAVCLEDVREAGKHNLPDADVVCGGSPCQSFSVAGLRKGLNDPRGNLLLEYLRIVDEMHPTWVVWENVPGVLSDKTGAISNMLDALEELGYIVDIDIIDAQWNGVAQRRRRVFVCGRSVDSLARKTTSISALIMAQCLSEILHGMLVSLSKVSGAALGVSENPSLSSDGIRRRMKLFGLDGSSSDMSKMWRQTLEEEYQRSVSVSESSDADHGGCGKSSCRKAIRRMQKRKSAVHPSRRHGARAWTSPSI